jgi:hypothetical protein
MTDVHHARLLPVVLAAGVLALTGCGGDAQPAAAPTPVATTQTPSPTPTTVAPTTEAPEPEPPKLGDKQTTELGTATVYAVKFPVKADDWVARDIKDKGVEFAVADIKVCANGEVDEDGYGFDAGDFQLVDIDSRTYEFWNVQVGARSPNLTDSVGFGTDKPRKGSCKRGWLTFQVPPKTKIASVEYVSSGSPLTWQVRK